jgi:hypothetical protein
MTPRKMKYSKETFLLNFFDYSSENWQAAAHQDAGHQLVHSLICGI